MIKKTLDKIVSETSREEWRLMHGGDNSVADWLVGFYAPQLTPTQSNAISFRLMEAVSKSKGIHPADN